MPGSELLERISSLEKDNQDLRGIISGLQNLVVSLEGRLNKLEGGAPKTIATTAAPAKPGIFF
jgi:elongation factor 1-delta